MEMGSDKLHHCLFWLICPFCWTFCAGFTGDICWDSLLCTKNSTALMPQVWHKPYYARHPLIFSSQLHNYSGHIQHNMYFSSLGWALSARVWQWTTCMSRNLSFFTIKIVLLHMVNIILQLFLHKNVKKSLVLVNKTPSKILSSNWLDCPWCHYSCWLLKVTGCKHCGARICLGWVWSKVDNG